MKPGHFIVIGIVIWIALSLFNSIWVYQSKGQIIAATIVGLSSIIWLTNKENRKRLRTTFSSKWPKENLLDHLTNTIQVGLITIFSAITLVSEIGKEIVRQSDGYMYIKSEVSQDASVIDKVGQIKYIAIDNYSTGLSFNKSQKQVNVRLIIFGTNGKFDVDVKATKTYDWKIKEITFY
ncbi:MAG: hypothetical protein JNL53_01855 [Cyclobacteriaceae bacterium]|nr:hypothetical protein [Cyclobacteriaceae bacterium]